MKILFVCFGYESIGVEYLSSALKKEGHQTYLIYNNALFNSFTMKNKFLNRFFDQSNLWKDKIDSINPDIIAFSTVTENYRLSLDAAKKIKSFCEAPIIFGGIHATSVPEKVLTHNFIDYVCVGEGEEAFCELCSRLEQKQSTENIKNIWVKKNNSIIKTPLRDPIADISSLSFPDKDLFYEQNPFFKDVYSTMAKRGCVYRCSYCHNSLSGYKKTLRSQTPENIIEELKQAKEKYKIKKVCFYDDMLLSDISWLKEFTDLYAKKINLPFVCAAHPKEITEAAIAMLESAHCAGIGLGLQSADYNLRKTILNRHESNEEIIRAISLLEKSTILVHVDVLIGIPTQTDQTLISTAKFLNTHKPDAVLPIWLKYYPKLPIIETALSLNILSKKDIDEIEEGIVENPFAGRSFSKNKAKLVYLLLLSPILPEGIFNYLIKRKLFKFFPAYSSFMLIRIFLMLASLRVRLFKRYKKKMIFSLKTSILYFLFLIKRKLFRQGKRK